MFIKLEDKDMVINTEQIIEMLATQNEFFLGLYPGDDDAMYSITESDYRKLEKALVAPPLGGSQITLSTDMEGINSETVSEAIFTKQVEINGKDGWMVTFKDPNTKEIVHTVGFSLEEAKARAMCDRNKLYDKHIKEKNKELSDYEEPFSLRRREPQ